ncbi:hypothetical protein M3Y98_00644500 [Aphelenchoides besseyi]|nr:hypothetical protein M3Y98_00644500 [Aphelenchoides besseyi]KAI6208606.1 hypothetical protein M3Y96_00132900 [Aphelenchoides besseyi]
MRSSRILLILILCATFAYFWIDHLELRKKFRSAAARCLKLNLSALEKQEQIRKAGEKRLMDLELFQRQNSYQLPRTSAFSTTNSSTICKGNDEDRCLPKFLNLETRMRVASRYKLSACLIQKSLSTVISAVMCYLTNETAFENAGRTFRTEYAKDQFCKKTSEVNDVNKSLQLEAENSVAKNWTLFAVVRDPIDRFLSGYVDKCIRLRKQTPNEMNIFFRNPTRVRYCNNCYANMTCFILKEYERFRNQTKSGKLRKTFEDRHFAPQNWRCAFNEHRYRFIRASTTPNSTESFLTQLSEILRNQQVPRTSLEFIQKEIRNGRTIQSTVASKARRFYEERLRSSPFLMEYIVRLFWHDFLLFDFKVPEINFN